MDEKASKEAGDELDEEALPTSTSPEVTYVGVSLASDDSKIPAGEKRIFPCLNDFISKEQYKELFLQFVYLIAETKAHECLAIESGNPANAWSKLQRKCYDKEKGIFCILTYKDSKKLKEWTVKFWKHAAQAAFTLEADELKQEHNAGLFRASEQANIFFKLQEEDREKKRKAQEVSDELQKKLDNVEKEMGFRPPGAKEIGNSKKMCHSTGLLRSEPKDAGTIFLENTKGDGEKEKAKTKPREHHRPGDFDGLDQSFKGMDDAVQKLSNLVKETIAQKLKTSFREAVAERISIKRKLKELDDDDEDDSHFKELLRERIQFLDETMKRTVRHGAGEKQNK